MDKGVEARPRVSEIQKYKSNLATLKSGEANPHTLRAMSEIAGSPFLTYSEATRVLPDATKVFQDAYGRDKGWEFLRDNPKQRGEAIASYDHLFRMAKVGNTLAELTRQAKEFPGGRKNFKEKKRIRQFLTGGYPPKYEPNTARGNRAMSYAKNSISLIDERGKELDKSQRVFYQRSAINNELRVSSRDVAFGAEGGSVGRIYINPTPETWGHVFNSLTELLANRRDLPFELKTFDLGQQLSPLDITARFVAEQQWDILNRGDKMVLYFDKANEDLIASIVLHAYNHLTRSMTGSFEHGNVPVFAEKFKDRKGNIIPGITFAQEPASPFDERYSFNSLLEEVIENNWNYLGTSRFEHEFRRGLRSLGRDGARPAFNYPASSSTKSFPGIAYELL